MRRTSKFVAPNSQGDTRKPMPSAIFTIWPSSNYTVIPDAINSHGSGRAMVAEGLTDID